MGLHPELLRGMYAYGLDHPPPLHQRAIIPLVKGHDAVIQDSGFEKRTLLAIYSLQKVDLSAKNAQVLILTPTRELAIAMQNNVIKTLGCQMQIDAQTCNTNDEPKNLQNAQIVVGTPGRMHDMLRRRVLNPDKIRLICIDEADELLSRGFKDIIYDAFHFLPQNVQCILASGTLFSDTLEIIRKFMHDPIMFLKKDEPTLHNTKQYYIAIEREEWKLDTICDLVETLAVAKAIIFCNTRRKVDWLNEKMHAHDFSVSALKQREALMKEFREEDSRILITTDTLARGLDTRGISPPVINYDMPANKENYVHRVTRGTLGQSTTVINFLTTDDVRILRDIERMLSTTTVSRSDSS
ncbi:hypothetical protein H0H87_005512 [Tephrocybe sp. NHM501043]|nr:hypothetical protein H0H87_005512 [Tephrocybe sp. NHM501043]